MEDHMCIVIDNGSRKIQGGFAGDDDPRCIFGNYVGKDPQGNSLKVADDSLCSFQYPVKEGIIENWDDMEKVWRHLFFNELKIVHPEDYPVILTETIWNPKPNREKSMEIMFESFKVPSFFLAKQPLMSLYASGRTTGMVLESGSDVSMAVPIYSNICLSNIAHRMEFGGFHLTNYMVELLTKRKEGYSFTRESEREMVRDLKEKWGFVALDFDEKMKNENYWIEKKVYELPDGKGISFEKERFQCPEALFQPSLIGKAGPGFHEVIHSVINKCDHEIHDSLYSNILLSGGNTQFPGMADRLQRELTPLVPPVTRLKIVAPPQRQVSTWIGASILGSLSTFDSFQVTKAEYEEHGSSIVHKKCF